MTFPSLPNEHANLQTVLNKLRVYAEKNKSLTVNTQKSEVMCFKFQLWKPAPPLYFDGVCFFTRTPSNIWAWCATSRSIWIPRLTQHFAHSRQARSESKSLFRKTTLLTGYMRTYGFWNLSEDICYSGWYVCESDLGLSLLTIRQRDGQSPSEMDVGSVEKDVGSQRHHAFMVCHIYVCELEPLQFNWFHAAMRLYNSLTKSNSYTMKKVFRADMQLNSPSKWLLVSPYSFCHGWSDTFIYLQTKTANLWAH